MKIHYKEVAKFRFFICRSSPYTQPQTISTWSREPAIFGSAATRLYGRRSGTWTMSSYRHLLRYASLRARFMGPTWGPSGADRSQVGPMLAPWTWLSGGFTSLAPRKYDCNLKGVIKKRIKIYMSSIVFLNSSCEIALDKTCLMLSRYWSR